MRFTSLAHAVGLGVSSLALACGSEDSDEPSDGVTSFTGTYGWSCAGSTSCQDVFDFSFPAGSVITFKVNNVSSGSVSQLAFYAPGVALGGVNLLTGNIKELRCTTAAGCEGFTGGEQVSSYAVANGGTYRIAVTREWGTSCGGTGTYHIEVSATKAFQALGQTREDAPSAAIGFECHQ
ncbi:MAG TPA: hypothetical protein VJU15_02920 [Gemmatimonadales bacterium]|nr:hypothetical protein [Gemmatimonadales bacterium]